MDGHYLTIAKKRFIPPAPLNRGPSGCSTGVKCSPHGMRSLFNWDPSPLCFSIAQNPTSLCEKWGLMIQSIAPLFSVTTNGCEPSGRGSVHAISNHPPSPVRSRDSASIGLISLVTSRNLHLNPTLKRPLHYRRE